MRKEELGNSSKRNSFPNYKWRAVDYDQEDFGKATSDLWNFGVEEAFDTTISEFHKRRYQGEFHPIYHGLCVFSLQFKTRFYCGKMYIVNMTI
jgi:hypothetical protein